MQAAANNAVWRSARTCYDHLAGRLGVALTGALLEGGVIRLEGRDVQVTAFGQRWLGERGIDVSVLGGRRKLAFACRDVTEGKAHVAGALGAAIARLWLERGWVRRIEGSRALELMPAGIAELPRWGVAW
ncbi:MAG TPA: transcriptional regulator, partial [Bacillota bacterium]